MFRPEPMLIFRVEIPAEDESRFIEELGKYGISELIQLVPRPIGRTKIETDCERFLRQATRVEAILERINKILPEKGTGDIGSKIDVQISVENIGESAVMIEEIVNKYSIEVDKVCSEVEKLRETATWLQLLKPLGITHKDIGDREFTFVKVGLIKRDMLRRLDFYLSNRLIAYTHAPGVGEDELVAIIGLKEEKSYVNEVLKLLNFQEFKIVKEQLPESPSKAEEIIKENIDDYKKKLEKLRSELLELKRLLRKHSPEVLRKLSIEREKAKLWRSGGRTTIIGWIPKSKSEDLRKITRKVSAERGAVIFSEPDKSVEPPVLVSEKGPLRDFQLLMNLRGKPKYNEVNPTPIVAILYPIMFGMMFGDVGQGLVFVILGLLFKKMRKSFLGLPVRAIQRIGGILLYSGICSVIFGFLYGEVFLKEDLLSPILLSPLHDQEKMIVIALLFGVSQIIIGLLMGLINHIIEGNIFEALFGFQGLAGMIYYVGGVILAIDFVKEGMTLGVFRENLPITLTVLAALVTVMLAPIAEAVIKREGSIVESLMTGFSHTLEMFLGFLANSVSYVRLAALAIAHGALGIAAAILSQMAGSLGFILINTLVILIEGLSTLIQSMRLIYYEFLTKFYVGGGKPFRPFHLR
ncbi:MAG TPA: hypothetical protein ENF42_01310 [Candidatus Bathyarchaeota archaeon]|nr:hypothetical protein [Candidatus Bathyarchaeota archaeon]